MKKIRNFKDHNCYKEQKLAYNVLFTDGNINGLKLDHILQRIDKFHAKDFEKHKVDIRAIKQCIIKNYDSYMKKPFIASDYNQISENLPL